jgi:hypothetical protein
MRVSAEVGGFKFISSKDFFLPGETFSPTDFATL